MCYGMILLSLMSVEIAANRGLSPPMPQLEKPDCTCRYFGQDKQLGDTVCIRRNGSFKMARCTRVLNNTHWQILDMDCPSA